MIKMGRLFINKNHYDIVDYWSKDKNILDFNSIENIEKFSFVASLGINKPASVQARKDYIRYESIPTKYKSILSSILLGKSSEKEIDKCANEDICLDEAEKCFEAGFPILKQKIDSANGDEELLMKRMMDEIDLLYESIVKSNLENWDRNQRITN